MVDLRLPEIKQPFATARLVQEDGGRTLVLRPRDLARPNRESVEHASGQRFETPPLPCLLSLRPIENRFALELIKKGADCGGLLKADTVITNQVGHAA